MYFFWIVEYCTVLPCAFLVKRASFYKSAFNTQYKTIWKQTACHNVTVELLQPKLHFNKQQQLLLLLLLRWVGKDKFPFS